MPLELIFSNLLLLNNSKILSGIMLVVMNFGSRYVVGDLSHTQNALLSSELFKFIIIYAIFFVGTRDIVIAFIMAIIYVIVIDGILNEKRRFCIIPQKFIKTPTNQVTDEDYHKAKQIMLSYDKQKASVNTEESFLSLKGSNTPTIHELYKNNLDVLSKSSKK
jgi:hypothetical protein